MSQRIQFTLPQSEIPAAWYNLLALSLIHI